jgi:hypothetical protein
VETTFSFDFAGGRPRVSCCENLGVGGVWHYVLVSLLLLAYLVLSITQLMIYRERFILIYHKYPVTVLISI